MKFLVLLVVLTAVLAAVLLRVSANNTAVSSEVKVAVRQLENGLIEFAIVHDGEYHYPRARVIEPKIGHNRWLHSSPIWLDVPLPQIERGNLDQIFGQIEASCGRQLAYSEAWRPPDFPYTERQAESAKELVRQQREVCHRQINVALQALALASLQDSIDPETALQYSISIDTTLLISDWTYNRMLDLIASHSLKA